MIGTYLDNFKYILQIWLSDHERLGETKYRSKNEYY